jgi:alkaline phosphatase D
MYHQQAMRGLLFSSLVLMAGLVHGAVDVVSQQPISKIAFGSCSNPRNKDQSIYEGILRCKPDLFVFLGDNIYGDTSDMEVMRRKYRQLGALQGYRKLKKQTQVLATWDDHDYGTNDGGKSYPMRDESKKVFLDFFGEPPDSPRRQRPGIYASYTFGPAGRRVQLILLDTRYFKDDIPRHESKTLPWYSPVDDVGKTLLGEEQWKWLEEQLQVEADVRILASSVQILAAEKGMESWGNFPHEQKRLFELLQKTKANHTVAISGDVHFAELSKAMIGTYPFYDLTSSGMTHATRSWHEAKNSFRVGEAMAELNAGLIEIDWEKALLSLNVINPRGEKLLEHQVPFSALEF